MDHYGTRCGVLVKKSRKMTQNMELLQKNYEIKQSKMGDLAEISCKNYR